MPRLRILPALLLVILWALPAFGQDSPLRDAALSGDSAAVTALVASDRLAVKPILRDLATDAARAGARDEVSEFERAADAVDLIAGAFEAEFGEPSLSKLARSLRNWDTDALASKVHADTLLASGIELRGSADTREASLERFRAAEMAYRQIGDVQGIAEVLGQIGYLHYWLDRSQYLPLNQAALEARRVADDRQLIGNSLNDLGLGYRLVGDFESARDVYLESERVRRAIGDTLGLTRLLQNIGIVFEGLGEYDRAREYYLTGGDLYFAVGDTARWITAQSNAAGVMTDYAGRHAEALGILMGLERELDAIDDDRARAVVLLTSGVVNRRLGNYEAAVEDYREVVRLSQENGFDDLLARATSNIGVVYSFLGRHDRAVPFFERALGTIPTDDRPGRADILLGLSSSHMWLKQYDDARLYADSAAAYVDDPNREASVLKMKGDILIRTGRPEQAVPILEEQLALAERISAPRVQTDALFSLGEAAERAGRLDDALGYYDRAVGTLENAMGVLTVEEDKARTLAQNRYLYEDIIHFLTSNDSDDNRFGELAFTYAERSKSRAFLDQLAEALARVREGVDPELRSDLEALEQNMAYLRGELASADPSAEQEKIGELKDFVRQMEGEYERVEREMRASNPRFAAIQYPEPVTAEELQSEVLAEGEVLLSYAVGDSSSTLWAVSKTGLSVHVLPVRSQLEEQVDLLRFALQNPDPTDPASFAGPARRLYETLLAPAGALLAEADQIILIPDGALHYVPFEALLASDGGETFSDLDYFLHQAPISYVQSASVLRQLRAEPRIEPSMELLAVGDPAFANAGDLGYLRGSSLSRLPFSGSEVESIASLFDAPSVLLAENATEDRVRELLAAGSYRFVHFATHGLMNDDRPDFSALALAGTGLLEAGEIFNLPVNADLVVLSACETGLGQLVKGEGMVGLTRAFMYAGAPSIMVSLWSVSDQSTSSLMRALYGGLVTDGRSKDDALRTAKQALINQPSTAHPFHWAPFVLIGRSD